MGSCPHTPPRFREGLYYTQFGKVQFGEIAACGACRRPLGEPKIWRWDKAKESIWRKFNGTSWALSVEHNRERPGAPLNFVDGKHGLVPEGWVNPQREIDDSEPPF